MKRIVILGSAGAGKTTLARQLGEILEVPVHHLDRIYWEPGWKRAAPETIRREMSVILSNPEWIVEGSFRALLLPRLEATDAVILLDLPVLVCLARAFRRYLTWRNRARPEMLPQNRDRFSPYLFWWILKFRFHFRTQVMRHVAASCRNKPVHVLTSRREVAAFVADLKAR